jgi:hypothetical protein
MKRGGVAAREGIDGRDTGDVERTAGAGVSADAVTGRTGRRKR